MSRGSELPGVALGAENAEKILESISEPLAMVVTELVNDLEKGFKRFGVAVRQIGILEDVAKKLTCGC